MSIFSAYESKMSRDLGFATSDQASPILLYTYLYIADHFVQMQLFAFDTAKKFLTAKADESPKTFLPPSLVAGALAGVSSTLCMYPLELIKTRLTIEVH